MNSAPDMSFFLWMALIGVGLIFVLGPLLGQGKLMRKLEKLQALLSKPIDAISTIKKAKYNIPKSLTASQIIESWFPHDETEMIEGAPAPICGRLTKSFNHHTGVGTVQLEVFYSLLLPNLSIPVAQHTGKLRFNLSENLQLKQTEIEYVWDGPELAITDMFSADYKVLRYLIYRTEKEFNFRGYREVTEADEAQLAQKRGKSLTGRMAKQWWRTYNAGAPGERVYSFWPNPQDYAEAVQNPGSNFKDDGLKNCKPVLNNLGIPKVTSGMFASVYQLKSDDEQWAVRCFDTRLIDQQERYKAISSFILSDDLTYTVDFHYLEDGIKCGGTWFPILKMTWVEGQSLDVFARENYKNFSALQKLRWEFQIMMEKLAKNGVAHGDLQHGNILVSSGDIYLVDYDGFYVPELEGKHSNELGHANYQHPTRTEKVFAPYMDNFSAFIIDFSLLCLMEDPMLWERFTGGDECLIFRKSDYVNPESSKLISVLKAHTSTRITNGVQKLLEYLKMPLEEIPYLQSDIPDSIHIDEMQLQERK